MPAALLQAALTKAQEGRPGEDVFGEAKLKMQERLQAGGWLGTDDALHCRDCFCWLISAVKPQ